MTGPKKNFTEADVDDATIGLDHPIDVTTNTPATIYCDPDNGNDSNDGSQSNPLATITEALDRVPILPSHRIQIDLSTVPTLPVTYDEDVFCGPIIQHGVDSSTSPFGEGKGQRVVEIVGDSSTPSNVKVRSLYLNGTVGADCPTFDGMQFFGEDVQSDEDSVVSIHSSVGATLINVEFRDPGALNPRLAVAVKDSYRVSVVNADYGTNAYQTPIKSKVSTVHASGTQSGTVTDELGECLSGTLNYETDVPTSSGTGGYILTGEGEAYDGERQRWYSDNTFVNFGGQIDPSTTAPRTTNNGIEVAIADSAVTASGEKELVVAQFDGTWFSMRGETFTP